MKDAQAMVRAFHDHFLADGRNTPTLRSDELLSLRVSLLDEEVKEFEAAVRQRDIVEITDALADMAYVILGTACVLGIDLGPVFDEIHRSNMTKTKPATGHGKPQKGPNYSPPDLRSILIRQGWKDKNDASA